MLATKVDFSKFINQANEGYVLIMGPSGEGKTFSGLTVSEMFAYERLTMNAAELSKAPTIQLEDVCHLAWDAGALDGIRDFGMNVPGSLDMQAFVASLGEHGPKDFPKKGLRDFLEAGYKPGMTHVLDDTVSSLDDIIFTYWTGHIPVSQQGAEDTAQMWQKGAATHSDYRGVVNEFAKRHGLQRIVLAHTAAKQKAGFMANTFTTLKATAEGRETDLIIPALTGKSGNVYIHHASMVLVLDQIAPVGVQNKERHLLCGKAVPNYLTKNRRVAVTGEVMDWAIGRVNKQLRAHRAS